MLFNIPIVVATILNLIALFMFNRYLKGENKTILKASMACLLIGYIIFISQYTDQITDALMVTVLMALSISLMLIPCYLLYKEKGKVQISYVVSHFIALVVLTGIRSLILISDPFYYILIFPLFTSLYVFRNIDDKIKAFTIVASLIVLRALVIVDYQLPLQFEIRQPLSSFYMDTDSLHMTQSKPVIYGVDYFREHYPRESISGVRSINRQDDVLVLIMYNSNKKNHRLIYKDNHVYDD